MDITDAFLVERRRDPALRHEDRRPAGALPGSPDRLAQGLGVNFLPELGRLCHRRRKPMVPLDMRPARALGSEPVAGVGLDPDEVVVARELEEAITDARIELDGMIAHRCSILVLQIRQGERHARRDVGLRADGGRASPVGLEHVSRDPPHGIDVPFAPGRVDAEKEATLAEPFRFVDGAGIRDQVAERGGGAPAVALEQRRKSIEEEATVRLQPARQREVVERHDRRQPMLAAAEQYPTVVIQRGPREFALFGLDPRPLDAQAQRVEAEPRHQGDVVAMAVVEIAGVTGGLDAGCASRVFPRPPVAVDIAPLDLVSRLRGAEQKALGEGPHPPYIKALSTPAEAFSKTPRSEYPRPRLRRRDWANLNGTWQFAFDAPD